MITFLITVFLGLPTVTTTGCPILQSNGNVCCILPSGQQCCSPTSDMNGRPTGCNCY